MQIRDQKTLFIDIFFPIFLILIGLELATIPVIKVPPDRPLMPQDLYKNYSISNKFYYNAGSSDASLKQEDVSSFIQDNMVAFNTTMFQMGDAVTINTDASTPEGKNLTQQLVQLDNYIYDKVKAGDNNGEGAVAELYVQ